LEFLVFRDFSFLQKSERKFPFWGYFGCWSETQQRRAEIGDISTGIRTRKKERMLPGKRYKVNNRTQLPFWGVLRLLVGDATAACRVR